MHPCPFCGQSLPVGSYYCKHCNRNLGKAVESFNDVVLATSETAEHVRTPPPCPKCGSANVKPASLRQLALILIGTAGGWIPIIIALIVVPFLLLPLAAVVFVKSMRKSDPDTFQCEACKHSWKVTAMPRLRTGIAVVFCLLLAAANAVVSFYAVVLAVPGDGDGDAWVRFFVWPFVIGNLASLVYAVASCRHPLLRRQIRGLAVQFVTVPALVVVVALFLIMFGD